MIGDSRASAAWGGGVGAAASKTARGGLEGFGTPMLSYCGTTAGAVAKW